MKNESVIPEIDSIQEEIAEQKVSYNPKDARSATNPNEFSRRAEEEMSLSETSQNEPYNRIFDRLTNLKQTILDLRQLKASYSSNLDRQDTVKFESEFKSKINVIDSQLQELQRLNSSFNSKNTSNSKHVLSDSKLTQIKNLVDSEKLHPAIKSK